MITGFTYATFAVVVLALYSAIKAVKEANR